MIRLNFRTNPETGDRVSYGGFLREDADAIQVGYSQTHGDHFREVTADIGIDQFEALAKEMVKVNLKAAIRAFGAALQDAFPTQPPRGEAARSPGSGIQS
jgi:hypothetical protein